MKEIGKVLKVNGNFATIEMTPDKDSCRRCPAHSLCGLTQDGKRKVKVSPAQNVNMGDLVEIEIKENISLKIAFFIYIVPLIMFFIGVIVASAINKSQNIQFLFGSAFFSSTFIILYFLDKRMKNSDKYLPRVIKIINCENSQHFRNQGEGV